MSSRYPTLRLGSYVPEPTEHVLRPWVASSLFPHLRHRSRLPFRVCLVVLLALLTGFVLLRWQAPMVAVAAVGLPLLFVASLHGINLRQHVSLITVVATGVLGLGLGAGWAYIAVTVFADGYDIALAVGADDTGPSVWFGVAVSISQGLLMIVPAVMAWVMRGSMRERLDGIRRRRPRCDGVHCRLNRHSASPTAGCGSGGKRPISRRADRRSRPAGRGHATGQRRGRRHGRRHAVVAAAGRGGGPGPSSIARRRAGDLSVFRRLGCPGRQFACGHPLRGRLSLCHSVVDPSHCASSCRLAWFARPPSVAVNWLAQQAIPPIERTTGGDRHGVDWGRHRRCRRARRLDSAHVRWPPPIDAHPIVERLRWGEPVEASPRFNGADGTFSVAYPAEGGAYEATFRPRGPNGVVLEYVAGDTGTLSLFGLPAQGRPAKDIALELLKEKYPNATVDYEIPNTSVGYQPGYGIAADDYPNNSAGGYTRVRVLVMVAVKHDYALVAAAAGPYHQFGADYGPGHPSGPTSSWPWMSASTSTASSGAATGTRRRAEHTRSRHGVLQNCALAGGGG